MNKKYFDLAQKISELSSYGRISIGAVIVKGGGVLACGVNKRKTHPLQKKYNKYRGFILKNDYLHAEMCAIINSRTDLRGAEMYVARRDKNGRLSLCRPCEACIKAMKDNGITGVYYTTANGYAYEKV